MKPCRMETGAWLKIRNGVLPLASQGEEVEMSCHGGEVGQRSVLLAAYVVACGLDGGLAHQRHNWFCLPRQTQTSRAPEQN